jgi:hypothetical protein
MLKSVGQVGDVLHFLFKGTYSTQGAGDTTTTFRLSIGATGTNVPSINIHFNNGMTEADAAGSEASDTEVSNAVAFTIEMATADADNASNSLVITCERIRPSEGNPNDRRDNHAHSCFRRPGSVPASLPG